MRLLGLLPLVTAAFALDVAASPVEKRLVDVESTILTLDKSAEALNSGRISLNLQRIDDLIDDQHNNALLLERVTHIGLTIQLDVQEGTLSVNGEALPMLLEEGEGIAVHIVKAEAYSMPTDLPAAFYEPENVQALTDVMSLGVAQVSVRLDSEVVPVDALGSVNQQDDSVSVMPVEGLSIRKLGLFVTIDEIEGTSFAHSRTVYAPIVQFLLTAQSLDGTTRVKQISTLSVGGQPVVAQAVHSTDFLPDVAGMLPAVEPAPPTNRPQQLWNGLRAPVSGLWGALESIFGQPRYEQSTEPAAAYPAYRPGAGRKGLALAPDAPRFDDAPQAVEGYAGPGRHGHHHHASGHCFWRKFSRGFLFIFAAFGTALTQTLPGILLLATFAGAVTFHAVRRMKHRCHARHEALPQYENDLPAGEFHDEKPPSYTSPASPALQVNLTIFDADALDEKA